MFLDTLKLNVNRVIWRLYPFYSGRYKLVNSRAFRLAVQRPAVSRISEAKTSFGQKILVDLSDLEGEAIYYTGSWDPRISWIAKKVLSAGDVFVDIGANYGEVTLNAAHFVGPTGRVHAFEPQPKVMHTLRRSAAINHMENIVFHELALSDRDGMGSLVVPDGHSGAASLEAKSGARIEVAMREGSTFFRKNSILNVKLMKIDVEGHEASVISGLSAFITMSPPKFIIFESADWENQPNKDFSNLATVKMLRNHGYQFFAVARSYLTVNLPHIPDDMKTHPPVADILAVHEDALTSKVSFLRL